MPSLFRTARSFGPTVLRLALGGIMLMHGIGKIHPVEGVFPGYGLQGTVDFMHGTLGVPLPLAYVGTLAEAAGGALLVLGLLTRLAGLVIAGQMATAAVLGGHIHNGFFMNWLGAMGNGKPAGEGFEFHVAAIAMALALVCFGGGKLSADSAIGGFTDKT
jgi:putative oxidoreductase